MLLVKRHSPASVLGSANGLLQFFICLSRAFGPITASSIFAVSVEGNIISGYLWAIFLSGTAMLESRCDSGVRAVQ
ncbi:hypothetical protein MPER_12930 [Moniliophthora perniciosa FA553]|nr:hypothetical protein MPER_12930 [Moniliophthora perniciosa FA553]